MTDTERVSHEEAEDIITTAPNKLLDTLPDTTETRAARRNLEVAAQYVHEAIEQSPRDRACP